MDAGEKVSGGFVVAGGYGPELLQFGEKIFDQVASLEHDRFRLIWAAKASSPFLKKRTKKLLSVRCFSLRGQ